MKQTFGICNIVHQLFAYESSLFEAITQTKLRFFQTVDSNYPNKTLDLLL